MAMRSQMERSSSSSEEVTTIVVPCSSLCRLKVSSTRVLAPISMPRVGSHTSRTSGWSAKALARQTFCWFPPESSAALCPGPVHLISRASMYRSASRLMARSSRSRIPSSGIFLRKRFCTCMAVKVMFQSMRSSRSRPTPRRSSETKAMRLSKAFRGAFSGMDFPKSLTSPPEG